MKQAGYSRIGNKAATANRYLAWQRILSPWHLRLRKIGFWNHDNKEKLSILNLAAGLRCQYATKSVNDVAIVAVDYVAIGGLHFQTIARCPGAAA